MRRTAVIGLAILICAAASSFVHTRPPDRTKSELMPRVERAPRSDLPAATRTLLRQSAVPIDTFVMAEYTFDGPGGIADPEGWTLHDLTLEENVDTFFHVADTTQLDGGDFGRLIVLEGNQSMWLGMASGDSLGCSYATLPGYGDAWWQWLESKPFARVGDVTFSFHASYDAEPAYEGTDLKWLDKDDVWQTVDTPHSLIFTFDDPGISFETFMFPDSALGDSLKIKFEFWSDGAWSDQDGLWNTDGAIILDSMVVQDATGMIDYQDFEAEMVGAKRTLDGDWVGGRNLQYGLFGGLFPGTGVAQDDGCVENLTHMWGFFNGSTADYACGGHPLQAAVPSGLGDYGVDSYIHNEVWSPFIDWTEDIHGTTVPPASSLALLEFDVYRDLSLDAMVFYVWSVREVVDGCGGQWTGNYQVSWGDQRDWFRHRAQIGSYVSPGATGVQVALGVRDMCHVWCGSLGSGDCHSHAPLFDNVRVVRLGVPGPALEVSAFDLYHDSFPADGSTTGKVELKSGLSIVGTHSDYIRVTATSSVGIDDHIHGDPASGPAVYCHVKDVSPAKSGAAVSGDLYHYPLVSASEGWTVLRCSNCCPYKMELNDNLYEPGDTIYYYFSARDTLGNTNYWSLEAGTVNSESEVRAAPLEVTCLPANAITGKTDILYIDNADRSGVQPDFEAAFAKMGVTPDRLDVLWPGNGPSTRVVDVVAQLADCYETIIWSAGNLNRGTIGDVSQPQIGDDFDLLHTFLDQHTGSPGLYISGDNVASEWNGLTASSALALRNDYMNFTLVDDDHFNQGLPVSPLAWKSPGSFFDRGPDTLLVYGGGCPRVNDFDVLQPTGQSELEMMYADDPGFGAVLSQATTNAMGEEARVVLSGFSFHNIRDDKSGQSDQFQHLFEVIRWLQRGISTGADAPVRHRNVLRQNYPNPFNPMTSVVYQVRERVHVRLAVFDVLGRKVNTLVNGTRLPGLEHRVNWDGTNDQGGRVASGVYFYRLVAGDFTKTRKMVMLK